MKRILIVLAALAIAGCTAAPRPGAGSGRQAGFTAKNEAVDSFAILPPPPAFDSVRFEEDRIQYRSGVMLRGTERGEMAVRDADSKTIPAEFSDAFGVEISEKGTPRIHALVCRLVADLGSSTRTAKNHYKRPRPYVYFKEHTCVSEEEERLRGNGSYPSGHTARALGTAFVLAEINPQRAERIIARALEVGRSRVICGYHWQSDVEASQVVAAAAVAKLHAVPEFKTCLAAAVSEFEDLKKAGKVKP